MSVLTETYVLHNGVKSQKSVSGRGRYLMESGLQLSFIRFRSWLQARGYSLCLW